MRRERRMQESPEVLQSILGNRKKEGRRPKRTMMALEDWAKQYCKEEEGNPMSDASGQSGEGNI